MAASTRKRLLEAAGQAFSERGFACTTIREICTRAGTNVAAVNYHFGDKRTLYREVFRHAFREAQRRHPLPTLAPDEPVESPLRGVVTTLLSRIFLAHEGWRGRLVARELVDPSEALAEIVDDFLKPLFATLEALIGGARPDLSPEARRLHVFSLLGQCIFFGHSRPILDRLFGPDAYRRERIPELADHIVNVFLLGLAIPGAPRPVPAADEGAGERL